MVCNEGYRVGGVIIYCNENIQIEESHTTVMTTADIIKVEISYGACCISILAFYRLHRFCADEFIDELELDLKNNNCKDEQNYIVA